MGPEHTMWWPWSGMWIFPMIMCVVFIGVIILFAWRWGCRPQCFGSTQHHHKAMDSESALDILNKRYAKAEITKEEYEHMKHDILS